MEFSSSNINVNNDTKESVMTKIQCVFIRMNGQQCKNQFYVADGGENNRCYAHAHIEENGPKQEESIEDINVTEEEVLEENTVTIEEQSNEETTKEETMTIEEKLALLNPKVRYEVTEILERFRAINSVEHNIDIITGKTDLSLTGDKLKKFRSFNMYRPEAVEYETRADRWADWNEITQHMPILVHLGVLPALCDIDVSIDFTKAMNPDTALDYLARHPEIDVATHTTLSMFYMAAQIGMCPSYLNNKGMIIDRHSAIKLSKRSTTSLFMDAELRDAEGNILSMDTPGHLNVPNSMGIDEAKKLALKFGLAVHGSPTDNERTQLAVSRYGTNDSMRIEQVLQLIATNKTAGKVFGKRQTLLKTRQHAHIEYNLSVENPFERDIATWQLSNGTIRVAVEKSPGNSGDGACFTTRQRMINVLTASSMSRKEAKRSVNKYHVYHENISLGFGFFKGNIIMLEEAEWRWDESIDLLFDTASFSNNPLIAEHAHRGAFLFNGIKVNTNKYFRVGNAEQLAFELMRVVAPEYLPLVPQNVLNHLQTQFREDYMRALEQASITSEAYMDEETVDVQDNSSTSAFFDKEDLFKMRIREDKSDFFATSTGIFASRTSANKYAGSMLAMVDKLLVELDEKQYCGLLLPMGSCRITAGHYSPVPVAKGSLQAATRPGQELPWIIFIDDELMASDEFKWAMEFVDSDDSVNYMVMTNAAGEYFVYLIKVPTSPNAGSLIPVTKEIAMQMGTLPVPMREDITKFSVEEVAEQLKNESPEYTPEQLSKKYQIKVTDKTTTMQYANEVSKIHNIFGNMATASDLNTLIARSGLFSSLPRAEYLQKTFAQMSVFVDANVEKTSSITGAINKMADNLIHEIHKGEGVDLKFLTQTRKEGLVRFLTRRYELLRQRQLIASMEKPMVDEEGNIAPVANTEFDDMWELIGSIPQKLEEPLRWNAAILRAVSNGPISNYTTTSGVSDEAYDLALAIWSAIKATRDNRSLSWQEEEAKYHDFAVLVEQAINQMDNYKAGSVTKLLAQCHAIADNHSNAGYTIHSDIPAGMVTPVTEYFGREELAPFWNKASLPTIFIPVDNHTDLIVGEDYTFVPGMGNEISIRLKNEDNDPIFASMAQVAARSSTPKAKKWALAAGNTTMTFVGYVAWSLDSEIDGLRVDPVAIFCPNLEEMLVWTV